MPLRQKFFAIFISIALLILIIDLVRRRKLREDYSWLWLLTGVVILILASWHNLLIYLTKLIGAGLPTSTLFFFSLVFFFLIAVQFSIRISQLTNQLKNLVQENGLLKKRVDELEENALEKDEEKEERSL
jgi:hypothetical protein